MTRVYIARIPSDYVRNSDGDLSVLVTIWDDGSGEVAVRPAGSNWTWSPPAELEVAP